MVRVRLVLVSTAVLVAVPHLASAQTPESRQIIDVHMHAYAADWAGEIGAPNPVTGQPSASLTDSALLTASLRAMEKHNITVAVLSGPADIVNKWHSAAPSRFLASPHFPVFGEIPEVESLRSQFEQGKLEALAELTFQYAGVDPSDPEVEPFLALAEELDIPVGIHMGLSGPGIAYGPYPDYRVSKGSPLLLEEALLRHPGLRVYIMHAGWPFLDDTIALMWGHPQVHADLAVINWLVPRRAFHDYLRRLVDAGLGKRLMFGSDQMIWPETIPMAIQGIETAEFLTEEQRRDIFYNNAARFFRLENDDPDEARERE